MSKHLFRWARRTYPSTTDYPDEKLTEVVERTRWSRWSRFIFVFVVFCWLGWVSKTYLPEPLINGIGPVWNSLLSVSLLIAAAYTLFWAVDCWEKVRIRKAIDALEPGQSLQQKGDK